MVASPHALASAAGVDALRAGGSAVDAAIAARVLARRPLSAHVRHRRRCVLADLRRQGARKVSYLDGGGRAAAAATLERFSGQSRDSVPRLAPATLTTPGAVASFCDAHERHGRLPFARCLQDAIHYARDGYPVTARLARWIEQTAPELATPPSAATFPAGSPPPEEIPRWRDTLRGHRRAGPRRLLRGRGGARSSPQLGGFFTAARPRGAGRVLGRADPRQLSRRHDLRDAGADAGLHRARDAQPARAARTSSAFLGPDHVHLLVQAKQIAYHDRDRWLADPRFVDVPIEQLHLEILCGRAPKPDRSGARAALGQGALLRQPHRRHGLRRRGRRARQRRVAHLQPVRRLRRRASPPPRPASCCRTAALISRSTRRTPIASSPARCRCTR